MRFKNSAGNKTTESGEESILIDKIIFIAHYLMAYIFLTLLRHQNMDDLYLHQLSTINPHKKKTINLKMPIDI